MSPFGRPDMRYVTWWGSEGRGGRVWGLSRGGSGRNRYLRVLSGGFMEFFGVFGVELGHLQGPEG